MLMTRTATTPRPLPALTPRAIRTLAAEHEGEYVFQAATDSTTGRRAWRSVCGCGHTTEPTRSMQDAIRDQGDHRTAIFTGARVRLADLDAR